ncbi:MAG TPA: MerR family transcriptional regulator [Mycobacteriales bacterium]|nr:MerR family transcriptional regulator [Mycobacteriales bacterium]
MRIGELSSRTGVSVRALRYYEEQGLLLPRRLPSGYREYAAADIVAVRHIRTLLAAGLSTSVIAEILPCMLANGEVLAPTCPELTVGLGRERDRITESIDKLQAARSILDTIIAAPSATRAVQELSSA